MKWAIPRKWITPLFIACPDNHQLNSGITAQNHLCLGHHTTLVFLIAKFPFHEKRIPILLPSSSLIQSTCLVASQQIIASKLFSFTMVEWIHYTFGFFSWLRYNPGKTLFCYSYTLVFQAAPFGQEQSSISRLSDTIWSQFFMLYTENLSLSSLLIAILQNKFCFCRRLGSMILIISSYCKVPGNWTQQPLLKSQEQLPSISTKEV